MDLAGRENYFRFAPNQPMKCEGLRENMEIEDLGTKTFFQQLAKNASNIVTFLLPPQSTPLAEVIKEF
jgi:hypothetical protein